MLARNDFDCERLAVKSAEVLACASECQTQSAVRTSGSQTPRTLHVVKSRSNCSIQTSRASAHTKNRLQPSLDLAD